ncbi:MAG: hypothetical protein WC222_03180 [Parachlamydiales bacterium]|jgi:hypothetical protein
MALKNLAENNLIRFISVSKKKEGLFVNFRVSGIREGTTFSASISVDTSSAEVDLGDPLEIIVEACAKLAVKQIQRAEFQFEGMQLAQQYSN